jgi:SAM-dependent methyltransferase
MTPVSRAGVPPPLRERLKAAARAVAPTVALRAWGRAYGGIKIARARRAFASVAGGDPFLPASRLDELMGRGFRGPGAIRYDDDGLVERAREKTAQLAARVPLDECRRVVELGCWDGMVLAALRAGGHEAIGADRSRAGIDARARAAGVRFVQTDAAALALPAASVDLVYSFAAFEHFADPDAVLLESARILRPGGHLFLAFGPVYTSPWGLHAYRQIPVPYCQYLFTDHDLRAYAARHGLPCEWPYVNGVTVTAYRELWARHASRWDRLFYREHPAGGVGAELIARYPSCFRGKVPAFDDLLVSAIEIGLRRR